MDIDTDKSTAPLAISGPLVVALEAAWSAIRARHPEVPEAVIVVGSGTAGRRAARYGSHAPERWNLAESSLAEVFISGEGLERGAVAVLGTLIHEAGHALARARGIQDTSRQGRWHNAKFKAIAEELGITVTKDGKIGWSPTTVPDETHTYYATEVDALESAIVELHRRAEPRKTGEVREKSYPMCYCDPPRELKISRKALDEGAILCGCCDGPFTFAD